MFNKGKNKYFFVLSKNTCKSSRNNTRLSADMFLLGRRHFGTTFQTGSTSKVVQEDRALTVYRSFKSPIFI